MKLLLKSGLLLLLGLLLQPGNAQAQGRVSVNVGPPAWGPAVGPGVEYYYIPEIDGYYDLYTQSYVYLDNGYWVNSPYLPSYYANYDPRFFHPVVIDYVGRRPWGYIRHHRAYCNQRGWQPGRYYGNNGYYRGNRGGYASAPAYRSAPGHYDNSPYYKRGYARGNNYDRNNPGIYRRDDQDNRDTYHRRDEPSNRDYQNAPDRNDRGFERGRDERSTFGGRGRSR